MSKNQAELGDVKLAPANPILEPAKKKRKVSPFKKAKAEQAFVKLGMYGPSGSGKTFTALLIAEGLANLAVYLSFYYLRLFI